MKPTVLVVGHFPPARGGIATFLDTVLHSPLTAHYTFVPFDIRRPTKAKVFHNYGYQALWNAGLWRALVAACVTFWHLLSFPLVLLRRRPDVVHIHSAPFLMFWETAYYALVARLFRRPVVFQFHSWFCHFYRLSSLNVQAAIVWVLRRTTRFIVICKADLQLLDTVDYGQIDYRYLPNFLDVRKFRHHIAQVDIAPVSPLPTVLFVGGNDAAHKGLHDLLQAIRRLSPPPACQFIFTAVPRAAVEQQLPDVYRPHCEIYDWVDGSTKAKLFARANVFVLPSYAEGMPIAIIEAMAAEAAVIATKVGGIPDLITDGSEGHLVNAGDVNGLSHALSSVLKDAAKRLEMGKHGLHKALRGFDVEGGAQQLHELYTELLTPQSATVSSLKPQLCHTTLAQPVRRSRTGRAERRELTPSESLVSQAWYGTPDDASSGEGRHNR